MTVGRDGTIVFTLRERTIVSVKAGADLKTVISYNGGLLFEQMCSLCVTSIPTRSAQRLPGS